MNEKKVKLKSDYDWQNRINYNYVTYSGITNILLSCMDVE